MICHVCDKNLKKEYYLCLCKECIKPGDVVEVIKRKLDKIEELSRYIDDQRKEIMDIKEENSKYEKIILEQKNKLLQRKK